jgi:two-component system LytT family sensor kinase
VIAGGPLIVKDRLGTAMNTATTQVSRRREKDALRNLAVPGVFVALTLIGSLSFARYYLELAGSGHRGPVWPQLVIWLTCYYSWVFLAPLVFRLEDRFPAARGHWPRNLAILTAASLGMAYLGYELSNLMNAATSLAYGLPILISKPYWAIPGRELGIHLQLYWSMVLTAYVIRKFIRARERERVASRLALEKAQLEMDLRRAELDVLRMRLNPHFLFNTLQNISVLVAHDQDTAGKMLTRLGDLLRAAFRRDVQPESTLSAEIELTKAYLEVEKMRFDDRLSITVDLNAGVKEAMVPVFLLQPLVENALKHGLQCVKGVGSIYIGSVRDRERLILTVADNGSGLPAATLDEIELGVGLGSTRERLLRMYPNSHEFSVRRLTEGGSEIRIVLPYRVAGHSEETQVDERHSVADS